MSKVRLTGATSGYVELTAPAVAGSNTLILPGGNGTAGQVLQTNGTGALSWETFKGPVFRAGQVGTQTLTSNVSTKLTLITGESYDTANCYSTSTQRFTPNVAGYYLITLAILGAGNTGTTAVEATIGYNGVVASIGSAVGSPATSYSSAISNTSAVLYFNGSTDYVEAFGRVVGTGTVTVTTGFFEGFMIRPA